MKKIIIIIITVLFASFGFAQETLKLNGNEFKISDTEYFIKSKASSKILQNKYSVSNITKISNNEFIIKTNYFKKNKQKITQQNDFQKVEPVLIYKDGIRQICNGEIILQTEGSQDISKLFKNYKIEVNPNKLVDNQYLIKFENLDTFAIFELIRKFQNNKKIEFIEPNFIRLLKPHTNDPYFGSQWAINNQGYLNGIVDADMDVDDAWSISTGLNIKVAVIDEGVDLSHPDLVPNLISGYDATGNNSNGAPNINNNDAHGTNCAGIIGAVANNNTGIAGVAYEAKIMPIRIAYNNNYPLGDQRRHWITNDNWISNGINWAWQNGADILSNSWGGGSPSKAISTAINNAVNNGRNGKGCIVLFSSGNRNNDSVSYPSSLNNVISVGASSMCDERKSPASCDGETWWGSNYGNGLDVVAPGVKIYATDISGYSGYTLNDYYSHFNGTSSACPQVAGVSALILAVNPELTYNQVREILEGTTDKVSNYNYSNSSSHPNGSWNNEVGYGRVNAYNAVSEALDYAQILGENTGCNNTTYNIVGIPNNVSVNWVVSSNLQIIGNTNLTVTVNPINSNISDNGYIEAHFEGKVKRKNIWVGKSQKTQTKIGSCYEPIYKISATYPDRALEFKVVHNGNTQYYNGSTHYEVSSDDYNLQDGQSTMIYVNIRNNCGWSQTYPVVIYKPTLCDCGYNNPSCGGSDGPPTLLDAGVSNKINIYPNPTKNLIHIAFGINKVKSIRIISSSGRIIDVIIPKDNVIHYDVSKYTNGLYIMEFISETETTFKKIIINH